MFDEKKHALLCELNEALFDPTVMGRGGVWLTVEQVKILVSGSPETVSAAKDERIAELEKATESLRKLFDLVFDWRISPSKAEEAFWELVAGKTPLLPEDQTSTPLQRAEAAEAKNKELEAALRGIVLLPKDGYEPDVEFDGYQEGLRAAAKMAKADLREKAND